MLHAVHLRQGKKPMCFLIFLLSALIETSATTIHNRIPHSILWPLSKRRPEIHFHFTQNIPKIQLDIIRFLRSKVNLNKENARRWSHYLIKN